MTTALAVTSKNMAPSNALAILTKGSDYLSKMSDLDRLLMEEGEDDSQSFAFVPTRIRVASGGMKSFQAKDGSMIAAPLVGNVIFAIKTRGYWPEKMDNGGNPFPLCSSVGNVFGSPNPNYTMGDLKAAAGAAKPHPILLDLDGSGFLRPNYTCAGCPMDEFGSAHQNGESKAKACKEKTMMFFLPKGWHQPVVLAIPTTSIGGWNAYCSSLRASTGKPFYAFETKMDIEVKENAGKVKYGQVVFSNNGVIDDIDKIRAVLALQGLAKEYLHANGVEADIFEDGPVRQTDEDGVIIDG